MSPTALSGGQEEEIALTEHLNAQYEMSVDAVDFRSRPPKWCIDGHSVISF
ncbi:fructose-bisphosphate aldolase [Streptomyces phaeochromogenes]|uniref:hypothetical protein n=1 Tax=Streptomyces phaeochromogenes TaxID=1923 RepID=UPI00386891E5|nr:fructose-bisphosphate aldolase [Streptomyces phaeochromogenes]